ncbi:AraC family transcriptional regulator [Paenibacillus pectinilyticus]|nr:AraC family transcriptional regulator [Paenibacillus pectinilyticus]
MERIMVKDLKWPVERDFIAAGSLLLLVSETPEGRIVINGKFFPLRAGTVFICRPGQLVEIGMPSDEEQGIYVIRFQAVTLQHIGEPESSVRPVHTFPGEGDVIQLAPSVVLPLVKMISSNWQSGHMAESFRAEAGFYELLSLILQNEEHKTAMALEYAKFMLERDFAEDVTIEGLAVTAGLSRFHFMRLFKEKFGKGVIEYVTELRLTKAKELMREHPDSSIREIAFQVGYKNEIYFSNSFKKHMGMAPALYLKNSKIKVAAYSWVNIGQLLALQVIPFAAPMDHYWTDYYRSKFGYDVTVPLSHHYDFNREALSQSRPDYIIGIDAWIPNEEQVKLAQLAPTLFVPWDQSWRQHLKLIADFIGKTKEAEKWLQSYEKKAAEIRATLATAFQSESVLVVHLHHKEILVWGRQAGTVLYDDLNFQPAKLVDQFQWTKSISLTQLADYEADHIVLNISKDPVSQAHWAGLSKMSLWRELPSVKREKVHTTPGFSGWESPWNEYTAFNHERFLQQMVQIMNPAT